jgi:hypothetical protein
MNTAQQDLRDWRLIEAYEKAKSAEQYWQRQLEHLESKYKELDRKKKDFETKLKNAKLRKENLQDELPEDYARWYE